MRVVNRVLALLVGLAVVAVAAIALGEVAVGLLGRDALLIPRAAWARSMTELRWNDPGLVGAGTIALVIGVALLVVELWPRRPLELPVRDHVAGRSMSIDRRGLQQRLRRVIEQDADVVNALVQVRRSAHVRVLVPPGVDRRQVRTRITERLRAAVDGLELAAPLPVQVRVDRVRGGVR